MSWTRLGTVTKRVMSRLVGLSEGERLALAKVGIEALVDEATGFQKVRSKDDLRRRLKVHLTDELAPDSALPERIERTAAMLKRWP